MSIKTKSQERQISAGENNPAALGDEENQGNSVSTNNEEMQMLLAERRDLKTEISKLTQRLGEYEYKIKNNIGRASTAWAPGYAISFRRYHRAEYTVPAKDIRVLRIKETSIE